MTDFLTNLVQRSLAATGAVRPQLLSIFEPPSLNDGAFFRETEVHGPPAVEGPSRDFVGAARSQSSEPAAAVELPGPAVAASSNSLPTVSESPAPPSAAKKGETSVRETAKATDSRFEPAQASPRVSHHFDVPAKPPATAEAVMINHGAGGSAGELSLASQQVSAGDPPGALQAPSPRENTGPPQLHEEKGGWSASIRASPVRPRVDLVGNVPIRPSSIARPNEARITNRNGESASATSARTSSEHAHDANKPSARESIPHPSTKNRLPEPRADKMMALMERERAANGLRSSARDIRAVSPRPSSLRSRAFAPPPKEPPVAPPINVTIGRIEVRAAPPSPVPSKISRAAAPLMNLDEYLRRRAGGDGR